MGIKNLSYKENTKNTHNPIVKLLSPLDDLPIPVRDTIKIAIDKRTPIHLLTARGCTGYCSFCSINSFFRLSKSPKWRGRSIDNIISEMRHLKSLGVQHIKVIDDSFVDGDRDAQWCRDFANKMQEIQDKDIFKKVVTQNPENLFNGFKHEDYLAFYKEFSDEIKEADNWDFVNGIYYHNRCCYDNKKHRKLISVFFLFNYCFLLQSSITIIINFMKFQPVH